MTDRMEFARFEALVAAYGATPSRWPEGERDAAEALARSDPRAAALLAEADGLDTLLFAHRVAEPSRTLRAMVLEGAPTRGPFIRRIRLWWSGPAFALAAAAGIVAGSAAAAVLEPVVHGEAFEHPHDDLPGYDDPSEEIAQ
ncbi:hypothetical protein [Sphingomonas crusticola]|uniref:hypothetical protein n=1 Tax=Sphingomonas crusticola TaxID=1697973 RepID=UPI0013C34AA6|nr:hypothetical protein [Sphingomonas crusticola]